MKIDRNILCALLLLPLFSAAAPAAASDVIMLKLRDGSIRWGELRGHDPQGIEFVRIENGGLSELPWSLLDPALEAELRRKFGYVDESGEELMIEADRLLLDNGREVIGRILSRSDDAILVKTAGATIPVPKSRIVAAATKVRVPAVEVFTREELYGQKLVQTDSADAAAQFSLAQHCERILDFAHAVEHYQAVQQLDASFRTDDVRWALERARQKAQRQDQIDYLAEIDLLAARKKFDDALQRASAFSELYPESPLLPDAKKKIARVEAARERVLRGLIVKSWHAAASRLARNAASKSYDEMLGYLDETLGEEVFALVVEEASKVMSEVEPDYVRQLWVEREGGRWRLASYGFGTWLLGEDAATEGLEPDEAESKPAVSAKDKEREALEARMKRFLQNQDQRRKSKGARAQTEEREDAWRGLSSASRSQWILAYYAENSGDMEIKDRIAFRPCRECGGTGVREIIVTGDARTRRGDNRSGSGLHRVACQTCQGIGLIRRIYFR